MSVMTTGKGLTAAESNAYARGVAWGFALIWIVRYSSLPMIMAGFFNPEYWAFKQIVK